MRSELATASGTCSMASTQDRLTRMADPEHDGSARGGVDAGGPLPVRRRTRRL